MESFEFECSMDFPVLQIFTNITILNADGTKKEFRKFIFYDYVLDSFFFIHPYLLNRGVNSYAPKRFYEKALERAYPRIGEEMSKQLSIREGSKIESVEYIEYAPYISSYKYICRVTDHFEFDFNALSLTECNRKNVNATSDNTIGFDLKSLTLDLYDMDLFIYALKNMGKMKYSYKSKSFTIEEDKYINIDTIDDNQKILLAKDYINNLNCEDNIVCVCSDNVKMEAKGQVIINLTNIDDNYENQIFVLKEGGIYSYVPCVLNTYIDLYDEYANLPVTLETKLNGDDEKNIATKIMLEMSSTGNVDVNVITKLASLMK